MIGRRVAKYSGKTLRHGYVNDYIPPSLGKAEPSWTVRYGEDEGKDEVDEVDRLELGRQLDLQQRSLQTAEWEPSPVCDNVFVSLLAQAACSRFKKLLAVFVFVSKVRVRVRVRIYVYDHRLQPAVSCVLASLWVSSNCTVDARK